MDRHDAQLQSDHKGHTLPELPVGSIVGCHNHITNKFDVGIFSACDARSYTIFMENGTHINRNHIDLKHTNVHFEPMTITDVLPQTRHVVSKDANFKHAPPTHFC